MVLEIIIFYSVSSYFGHEISVLLHYSKLELMELAGGIHGK